MDCGNLLESSTLRQDLEEYEQLHKAAKRPRVQEHLLKEIDRVRREVLSLESKKANKPAVEGFDQTKQYMELYLSLDNLSEISDGDIEANFTNRSVTVKVHYPNKICQLQIARLCEDIVPEDSYCKKKSKHVVVYLKKTEVGKTWATLTEREKKAKEKKD
ncbi:unnamed protein product, partial [Candidula unifasciata]